MTVKDLARTNVITASPDTPVETLAKQLKESHVGSVVITDKDHPVGMVTDRDLVTRVFANIGAASGLIAEDVMSQDPVTIEARAGILQLTELMRVEGIRRIPVVENDKLVGIVTLDDVQRLLAEEISNLASVIEKESPQ